MDYKKKSKWIYHLISAPFIYSVLIPAVITDIWTEVYHRICFYLYGIPYINRWSYIKVDRHKLSYLPIYDKLNCAYCGYVNGLFNYWTQIGAETEKYWCGIKHKKEKNFHQPNHHKDFIDYDDKDSFDKFSK